MIGLTVTGIFATGAFAVQMWAQQLIPAQQVALIFASEPAYAAWLSWYFLGEITRSTGMDRKRIDSDGGADRRVCVAPAAGGRRGDGAGLIGTTMAQKFGNGRWVQEGFLDNRVEGTVVGRIVFAAVGPVDLYLKGDFKPDIAGQIDSISQQSI